MWLLPNDLMAQRSEFQDSVEVTAVNLSSAFVHCKCRDVCEGVNGVNSMLVSLGGRPPSTYRTRCPSRCVTKRKHVLLTDRSRVVYLLCEPVKVISAFWGERIPKDKCLC